MLRTLTLTLAATLTFCGTPDAPSYALTQTTASGDVYVLDHGLTAEDCQAELRDGLACELEANLPSK